MIHDFKPCAKLNYGHQFKTPSSEVHTNFRKPGPPEETRKDARNILRVMKRDLIKKSKSYAFCLTFHFSRLR